MLTSYTTYFSYQYDPVAKPCSICCFSTTPRDQSKRFSFASCFMVFNADLFLLTKCFFKQNVYVCVKHFEFWILPGMMFHAIFMAKCAAEVGLTRRFGCVKCFGIIGGSWFFPWHFNKYQSYIKSLSHWRQSPRFFLVHGRAVFQDSAAGFVTNLTDSNFEDGRAKSEILIVSYSTCWRLTWNRATTLTRAYWRRKVIHPKCSPECLQAFIARGEATWTSQVTTCHNMAPLDFHLTVKS